MTELNTDHGTFDDADALVTHLVSDHDLPGTPAHVDAAGGDVGVLVAVHDGEHDRGRPDHRHSRRAGTRADRRAIKDAARWLQSFFPGMPYATCLQVVRDRRDDLLPDDGGTIDDRCAYRDAAQPHSRMSPRTFALEVVEDICSSGLPADPRIVAVLLSLAGFDVHFSGGDGELVVMWQTVDATIRPYTWDVAIGDGRPQTPGLPSGCPDAARVARTLTGLLTPAGAPDGALTVTLTEFEFAGLADLADDRALSVAAWPGGEVTVDNGDTIYWWLGGEHDDLTIPRADDYVAAHRELAALIGRPAALTVDSDGGAEDTGRLRLDVGDDLTIFFVAE